MASEDTLFNVDRSQDTTLKGGSVLTLETIESALIQAHRAGLEEREAMYRYFESQLKNVDTIYT